MKILTAILFFLFASCASYHDGHKKGIFLKNDASMPVKEPISALIGPPRIRQSVENLWGNFMMAGIYAERTHSHKASWVQTVPNGH
jgi:hypothetical protein